MTDMLPLWALMTQQERVLCWLKMYGKITTDGIRALGIGSPRDPIYELREDGWAIDKRMISSKNQYGLPCEYAEYYILLEPELFIDPRFTKYRPELGKWEPKYMRKETAHCPSTESGSPNGNGFRSTGTDSRPGSGSTAP